ncbi:MAG: nucleotidyltransferase domain-containing protein [Clostridia bacterium]|nr:nucleotidyltransferase domain-containing protein [Clostridia bacterium]
MFPLIVNGEDVLRRVFPSKQAAAKAAIDLARRDERISCLWLFGSALTTDCGMTSDLDLAIDAPGVGGDEFLRLIRPFYRNIDSEVDIVDYNDLRNLALKEEITNKGVRLYVKRE